MPKDITGNLALTKANDIFKSTVKKMDGEIIVEIPLDDLHAPDVVCYRGEQ